MVTEIFSGVADPLTDRELQVLDLISRGLSNREIADELVVTPETVKWYNKQIYRKLGVNSRTKAVVKASQLGFFEQSIPASLPRVAYEHNLPAPLTSFIGRENEISEIKNLMKNNRLLTLTGSGGSGKSRLALHIAAEVIDQFINGVFVVDLAPIWDAQLFLDMIAATLGIREFPGVPLINTLKHTLADKRMLLILDNFEQILDAALYVSELLSATPQLKVLATSREALSIYGEQVYHVPPLSNPDPRIQQTVGELLGYESIQLFYQRASAVKPDFIINDQNAADIVEICMRLDGLPLAIELAAARSNLYSPEMIRSRLDHLLELTTGGSRDLPTRLQTLRGTLDWSYDLLQPSEQKLLARLSVFQGGRTINSSEAICSPGLSMNVMDGLESLLNKNLLYQEQGQLGEPRFYLLETIHEYAHEKLVQSGEADEIVLRHSQYFTNLAEEAEQGLYGPRQGYWLKKLRLEYGNLREAMKHSLGGADARLGFQIVGALRYFWYSEGLIAEGLRWIERALDHEGDISPKLRAKVYICASDISFIQGNREKEEVYSHKAMELASESGDKLTLAWAMLTRSKVNSDPPDRIDQGIQLCEKSLAIFREFDYLPGMAITLNVLGELSRLADKYDRAEDYYRESLRISRQAGDNRRAGVILSCLAAIAMYRGDYREAEQLEIEAIKMVMDLGTKYYIALGIGGLAGPIAMLGHPIRAAILLGASQNILQAMGGKFQPADQVEVDRYRVTIEQQLDEKSLEKALSEGRAMSLEEALAFALQE